MKIEEQTIGVAENDKRSALEAIKKRFHDALHNRMEVCFSFGHA